MADITQGITANQGANDDIIFSLKSSDVAHGIVHSAYPETCDYFTIDKQQATSGGARLRGYTDADGYANGAIVLQGILGEDPETTHSASGYGVLTMRVSQINSGGCNVIGVAACANLFSVDNHTSTKLIIAGDGDVFSTDSDLGGGIDYFDDVMLIRSTELVRTQTPDYCAETACYKGIIKSQHDDWTRDHYTELKAAGLYDLPPWEGGLLNTSQWRRLANGAIWKLYIKVQDQAAEILGLRNDMTAIQGGK
jgi:hypothetical protein